MAEVITERIFSMVITNWEHHLTPQHVHCNCEFMNWTESSVNFANLLFWTEKKVFLLNLKLYFNLLTEAIFSFLITHFKIKKYYYHFNFYYVIFYLLHFYSYGPIEYW